MTTCLGNFTHEDFDVKTVGNACMCGGRPYEIMSGKMMELDDKTANHLLHNLQKRGLVSVGFQEGQNPEKLKAAKENSRRVSEQFMRNAIENFNQENQQRERDGVAYEPPTEELRKFAEITGTIIYEAWKHADAGSRRIQELTEENASLSSMLQQMNDVLNEQRSFIEKMKADSGEKSNDDQLIEKCRSYKTPGHFRNWLSKFDYLNSSLVVQQACRQHWSDLGIEEGFPY